MANNIPIEAPTCRVQYFLTLMLLICATFMRGLYFDKEFIIINIFLFAIIVLTAFWGTTSNRWEYSFNITDFGAIGLLAMYIVSTLYAAYHRDALVSVLKYLNYIGMYFLISYYTRRKIDIKWIFRSLYVAAIVVSIAGIGAYLGTFKIAGGVNFNRISSFLQYPNTLAIYLTVAYVFGVYLAKCEKWRFASPVFHAGNFVVLISFWGTDSRGGTIAFGIALLATLLCIDRSNVFSNILSSLVVILGSFGLCRLVIYHSGSNVYKWGMVFLGVIAIFVFRYILDWLLKRYEVKRVLTVGMAIMAGLVVIGGLVVGSYVAKGNKTFNLSKFNLKERNLQERVAFDRDAIKIIRDHPMGIGGGGWAVVNRKYQGHFYETKDAHNYFLQTAVETGIFGLAALLVLLLSSFVSVLKLSKIEDKDYACAAVTAGICIFSLSLHSMMDFNMSLGLIAMIFWGLLGLIRGISLLYAEKQNRIINVRALYAKGLVALVSILVIAVSLSIYSSISQAVRANSKMKLHDYDDAYKAMYLAHRLDPLNYVITMDLSQIKMEMGSHNEKRSDLVDAKNWATASEKLNSWDPEVFFLKAKTMLLLGEVSDATKEIEKARELSPMSQRYYDALSEIYILAGKYYHETGDKKLAQTYFKAVTEVLNRANQQNTKIPPERREWALQLINSPLMQKNTDEALTMLQRG